MSKKKTKPAKKKLVKGSVFDSLGIPANPPTDPKILINEKVRDKMLKALENTDNAELNFIIEAYNFANEKQRKNIRTHYERNGTLFISSIFRGVLSEAISVASPSDAKLLSKIKPDI